VEDIFREVTQEWNGWGWWVGWVVLELWDWAF
jgi:hypothetical protein